MNCQPKDDVRCYQVLSVPTVPSALYFSAGDPLWKHSGRMSDPTYHILWCARGSTVPVPVPSVIVLVLLLPVPVLSVIVPVPGSVPSVLVPVLSVPVPVLSVLVPVPGPVPLVSVTSVLVPVMSVPVPVVSVYWTKLCSWNFWFRNKAETTFRNGSVSTKVIKSRGRMFLCQFTAHTAGGSRSAGDGFFGLPIFYLVRLRILSGGV